MFINNLYRTMISDINNFLTNAIEKYHEICNFVHCCTEIYMYDVYICMYLIQRREGLLRWGEVEWERGGEKDGDRKSGRGEQVLVRKRGQKRVSLNLLVHGYTLGNSHLCITDTSRASAVLRFHFFLQRA